MGVGRIDDVGSSLPVVWRGPQSHGARRDLAVPATRRVLVGTPLGHAPRLPVFGAGRTRVQVAARAAEYRGGTVVPPHAASTRRSPTRARCLDPHLRPREAGAH